MAETHQAELARDPAQSIVVTDPEPLASARLFKFVSDEVWGQRPADWDMATYAVTLNKEPLDVLTAVNDVVGAINERFVIAGADKDLQLGDTNIDREALAYPIGTSGLVTYNWDERFTSRQVEIDGETRLASFTDGHVDYARELYVGFHFEPPKSLLVARYVMQRYQFQQGGPTHLAVITHLSTGFKETDYDGALYSQELTEEQETQVLGIFANLGDVATEGFTTK